MIHLVLFAKSALLLQLILNINAFAFNLDFNDSTIDDFQHIYQLEFSGDYRIYEFDFTEDIYKNIKRPDLGDLRVFNSANKVVPHVIISSNSPDTILEKENSVQVKFSAVYSKNKTNKLSRLNKDTLNFSESHQYIAKYPNTPPSNDYIESYVIDTEATHEKFQKLNLSIDHTHENEYIKKLKIYGSNDLNEWSPIEGDRFVARKFLTYEALEQNYIELDNFKFRYLRILWNEPSNSGLKIYSIHSDSRSFSRPDDGDQNWITLKGKSSNNEASTFYYELPTLYPISKLKFIDDSQIISAQISLSARNHEESAWSPVNKRSNYKINQNGEIKSSTLEFLPVRFKHWRVKFFSEIPNEKKVAPEMKFGWVRDKVRFIAQGRAPFFVGFGNPKVIPYKTNSANRSLIGQNSSGQARLVSFKSKSSSLPPTENTHLPSEPNSTRTKYTLWFVLTSASILLLILIRTLIQKTKFRL